MATRKGQRIGIWIIAVAMIVGTLASFAALVLAPNTEQAQQKLQEAELQKQMEEYQKQEAERLASLQPLAGYSAQAFDAASVTDLKVETLVEGTGEALRADSTLSANYFGWTADGKIFDSTNVSGKTEPRDFSLAGVISGWTEGLTGAKVGSTVKLTIPTDKAYKITEPDGSGRPAGPLVFIIEVKELKANE